jgi:hypothetical protein
LALHHKEIAMTDAANSPDPVPTDDDTAWPDPVGGETPKGEPETDVDEVIEENTAVLGSPD